MRKKLFMLFVLCFLLTISTFSQAESNKVDPLTELKAASEYFHNLGIGELECDIKVLFDPSNRWKRADIEKWNVPPNVYTFIGNYYYKEGGIFRLRVFGEIIAENDSKTATQESTIVVPLVPLPGGIMCDDFILQRYVAKYQGESECEDYPCYIIRLEPIKPDEEYFSHVDYYIDKKDKVVRKVKAKFDYGMWQGHGEGEFFYKKKRGKLLPNVGHGSMTFRSPFDRTLVMWGKWAGFNIKPLGKTESEKIEDTEE
jgi:hypothetical protein